MGAARFCFSDPQSDAAAAAAGGGQSHNRSRRPWTAAESPESAAPPSRARPFGGAQSTASLRLIALPGSGLGAILPAAARAGAPGEAREGGGGVHDLLRHGPEVGGDLVVRQLLLHISPPLHQEVGEVSHVRGSLCGI